jgi:hypothetical protein
MIDSVKPEPLTINGLMMPSDFPVADFEAIHKKIAPLSNSKAELYSHYGGAWNAVSYRYMALVEYGEAFTQSVRTHGAAPEARLRYQQEKDLFGLFANGFSIFESLFFGLFAIGGLLDSAQFPLSTPRDQRRVSPKSTFEAFNAAFPNDPIISSLSVLLDDTAYKEWQEIRNVLTHRSAPGRQFYLAVGSSETPPSQWKLSNIPLDANTAPQRRAHAARLLSAGMQAVRIFVEAKF